MAKVFKNRKIIRLKETESTNFYINSLPSSIPDGTVVCVEFQYAGRGQGKNVWESEAGKNLLLSIKVYPSFLKAYDQFYLSKIVSLAVADFVVLFTDKVSVKWPNDIYCGNKKISGILIENSLERDFIKESVIGIGININQEKFISGAINPVSLKQLTGEHYDLDEMLDIFVSIFDYRYQMLKESDLDTIDENYFEILFKNGVLSKFKANDKEFLGTITHVDKTGELHITLESGEVMTFLHKEVEYVI
jgi:BirA family transcriptional regulator, biotin operon repressor / biotin---[acetyl-CoA-carboxylase] ligase